MTKEEKIISDWVEYRFSRNTVTDDVEDNYTPQEDCVDLSDVLPEFQVENWQALVVRNISEEVESL